MVEFTRYIIMGVSGCGKSTIGKVLASKLDIPFLEGDAFHPVENVEKMRGGTPLTNSDREAWIRDLSHAANEIDGACVISCSALNQIVRNWIETQMSGVCQFVLLEGKRDVLLSRLNNREDHFFNPDLLDSQLEALEVPANALRFNIGLTPDEISKQIIYKIPLKRG